MVTINLSKIGKIVIFVWTIVSGILMLITGITHFCKNKYSKYRSPSKFPAFTSQSGLALLFQALFCIVFGLMFILLPFFSFLGKVKFIKTITICYNRATLIVFYLVGGLLMFPLCGWMGLIFAIIFWLSLLLIIASFFITKNISTFKSESSSDKN
ncbi:hypothetical protein EHI8A_021600 [Entamoeba histolytica HM-1:IMSS-B]|uniref:Uncharacterized protein n=6 Tax=Entamoeba histolytica TaxID=5759 RepID=C4M3W6_ENTH1|nr:hypothetical protein EHI_016440 [Entamoeba histolytica HM-1:IMSS]EMD48548.1 Hypothetical protein EHI5A_042870 [Entamoeba histolytica KU27]EMH72838.1 hypothetical protein EHI8A_021600 [Entamoeba histolytica HM-1:IMSS-B]EMS15836.1 hypothetical protein KM1_053510 [Entamoeba histolytica HM-3:IMSS]ENY61005.1 hypothetical protein EHI7A_023220 [Entamoeba histolytica HM-1:IMSS-A]GAT96032.1 hypothetical protein CL6EHI_016440 [Entamoeba histolytica]|eukprot:XP_653521.2 hypothetical protein EHI_016440 [Entamoeba histolytica HM-1:IMSS]